VLGGIALEQLSIYMKGINKSTTESSFLEKRLGGIYLKFYGFR